MEKQEVVFVFSFPARRAARIMRGEGGRLSVFVYDQGKVGRESASSYSSLICLIFCAEDEEEIDLDERREAWQNFSKPRRLYIVLISGFENTIFQHCTHLPRSYRALERTTRMLRLPKATGERGQGSAARKKGGS